MAALKHKYRPVVSIGNFEDISLTIPYKTQTLPEQIQIEPSELSPYVVGEMNMPFSDFSENQSISQFNALSIQ
ncbi:MAG: hypothetical protein HAW62_04425 [Endozoicomonadaceae bacterium]|nr:hypothetical protein [Endozoicomonadaceae bacterium]